MKNYLAYDARQQGEFVRACMIAFSVILIVFGFLCDPPDVIFRGIFSIIGSRAGLITDSIVVGGMGAAFVNAGLVTLISIVIISWSGLQFSGISVACLCLMAGFSLFGKDVWNILPILLGSFLYSRYKKEPFSHYVYVALFGTALSPVVSELVLVSTGNQLVWHLVGLAIGVLIGFVLPPVAGYTLRVHQGYNLYNVGFAAGLIGMILTSLFRSFGRTFEPQFEWSGGNNLRLSIFLFLLFALMFLVGFFWNGKTARGLARITRHSGRLVADFTLLDGLPVTLMNMAVIGGFATSYVLLVRGQLNGPTIGGILSMVGFGAFGKHLRNIIPVMLGVVLSSFFMVWSLNDPHVLIVTLFSTGLAPIAGQFGWKWGLVAGIIHGSVALNVSILNGGLNLYNNGFSAGLICIVLVPLIEGLRREHHSEISEREKERA